MSEKIKVVQLCDGFKIIVPNESDPYYPTEFHFDQEETVHQMVEMFKLIGIDAEYEEEY